MKKNKLLKRVGALVLAAGIAGGCGFGGWKVYQQYHGGAVEVYNVMELSTNWWGDTTSTEGFVTTDRLQAEFLSNTQTLETLMVKEGQEVKKGDLLFTYDSTLSDIELQRKKIDLQRKEMELDEAKKTLKTIRTYKPNKPIPGSVVKPVKPVKPPKPAKPEKPTWPGLDLLGGKGTEKNPYRYYWLADFQYNNDFLAAAMQGDVEAFVTFYLPEEEPIPLPEPEPIPDPDESGDISDEDPDTGEDIFDGDDSDEDPDTGEGIFGGDDSDEDPDTGEGIFGGDVSEPAPDGSESAPEVIHDEQPDTPEKMPVPKVQKLSAVKAYPTADDLSKLGNSWTMQLQHTASGYRYVMLEMTTMGQSITVSQPMPKLDKMEYPVDDSIWDNWDDFGDDTPSGIIYTKQELADMILAQEESIKSLDIEYRQLKLEMAKLEAEVSDSSVYAKLDGVVILATQPEDVEYGTPVVKVSGGGGYLVRGSISELDLENVEIGQSVTVNNWMTGEELSGTISEISDYPSTNQYGYWGGGNSNASYYAFYVSVDESASLEENSYVDMSYSTNAQSGSQNLYLMKSFVRTKDGQSYVYLDNNGVLEKVYVTTGRNLWGSYLEITSGNIPEDGRLAFPYGQRVREAAPTVVGDISSLYNYY